MTECQGCGAWNDTRRTLCVLCGTPLAETDEWDTTDGLPPLPPLPDGGLGATMPSWLRAAPTETADVPVAPPVAAEPPRIPALAPLGPRADPRTFLSDDDFPPWLRALAAREARPAPAADPARPPAWPDWPGAGTDGAPSAPPEEPPEEPRQAAPISTTPRAPVPDKLPPAAPVAARALEERRTRSPWETLLLVILFIGVVVAALWALASNGVFSPSL